MDNPIRYFKTSPEIIRLAAMMYVRFPLSRRNVEDLLREWGIDISHEAVRFWWDRFGPVFAAEIRKRRIRQCGSYPQWRWHAAKPAIFDEPSILKARYSRRRRRNGGIAGLR